MDGGPPGHRHASRPETRRRLGNQAFVNKSHPNYMGARFYDPDLGRFLQIDPGRQYWNSYSYVGNNPINLVDLTGLFGDPPNPAPQNILGTMAYYKWRYNDFLKRNPGVDPPAYYLSYGDKYVHRFSEVTFFKLSPSGQDWLKKALVNLQVAIETKLANDPEIELRQNEFTSFAFESHVDAYDQAGFQQLSVVDKWSVLLTPDPGDLFSPAGKQQGEEMVGRMIKFNISHPLQAGSQLLDSETHKFQIGNMNISTLKIMEYQKISSGVNWAISLWAGCFDAFNYGEIGEEIC